jgi:DNA repair protein RadA/Sms
VSDSPHVANRPRYTCSACGLAVTTWLAQCPNCAKWQTITAADSIHSPAPGDLDGPAAGMSVALPPVMATPRALPRSTPAPVTPGADITPRLVPPAAGPVAVPLSAASLAKACARRVPVGIGELDRVLGGGLVDGSVILLGGEPGCGKSTLLLQVVAALVRDPARDGALYASGEESADQIGLRAARLGIESDAIMLLAGDDLDHAIAMAGRMSPTVLVVDSIQTMRTAAVDSAAGSIAQVGECAARLARFAKLTGTPVILIGQVTKDGAIAGPKSLEHLVDVVLYLEVGRGNRHALTTPKNRHGSTAEVGTFAMGATGLTCVTESERDALAERAAGVPGSAVFPAASGDRVQLVEVQALVGAPKAPKSETDRPKGQLAVSGIDAKRVQMILAILERHAGIDVSDRDVFVSVTGGAKIADPAADLPIALAIASSYRDLPIDPVAVAFGELGLAGEVRSVACAEGRVRQSMRQGFGVIAASALDVGTGAGAKNVAEAIALVIGEAVAVAS